MNINFNHDFLHNGTPPLPMHYVVFWAFYVGQQCYTVLAATATSSSPIFRPHRPYYLRRCGLLLPTE